MRTEKKYSTICEMCGHRPARRFGETVRKSGGGGRIMNLCDHCMDNVPAINRKFRV